MAKPLYYEGFAQLEHSLLGDPNLRILLTKDKIIYGELTTKKIVKNPRALLTARWVSFQELRQ